MSLSLNRGRIAIPQVFVLVPGFYARLVSLINGPNNFSGHYVRQLGENKEQSELVFDISCFCGAK